MTVEKLILPHSFCGHCQTKENRYPKVVMHAPSGRQLTPFGQRGRNMVLTGWVLAYRRYSTDYVGTEDKAREAKRGMWKGKFVPPWEWRRGK